MVMGPGLPNRATGEDCFLFYSLKEILIGSFFCESELSFYILGAFVVLPTSLNGKMY